MATTSAFYQHDPQVDLRQAMLAARDPEGARIISGHTRLMNSINMELVELTFYTEEGDEIVGPDLKEAADIVFKAVLPDIARKLVIGGYCILVAAASGGFSVLPHAISLTKVVNVLGEDLFVVDPAQGGDIVASITDNGLLIMDPVAGLAPDDLERRMVPDSYMARSARAILAVQFIVAMQQKGTMANVNRSLVANLESKKEEANNTKKGQRPLPDANRAPSFTIDDLRSSDSVARAFSQGSIEELQNVKEVEKAAETAKMGGLNLVDLHTSSVAFGPSVPAQGNAREILDQARDEIDSVSGGPPDVRTMAKLRLANAATMVAEQTAAETDLAGRRVALIYEAIATLMIQRDASNLDLPQGAYVKASVDTRMSRMNILDILPHWKTIKEDPALRQHVLTQLDIDEFKEE